MNNIYVPNSPCFSMNEVEEQGLFLLFFYCRAPASVQKRFWLYRWYGKRTSGLRRFKCSTGRADGFSAPESWESEVANILRLARSPRIFPIQKVSIAKMRCDAVKFQFRREQKLSVMRSVWKQQKIWSLRRNFRGNH